MPPRILPLALLLAAVPSSAAQKSLLSPGEQRHILNGINNILKMDFEGAQRDFKTLEGKVPGHPFPHFGYASLAWLRYIYENEQSDQSLLQPFDQAVADGLRVSDAWVKKHPEDAEGWMARGAIHGLYARLLVTRRRFVKGYFTARTAMKSIHKSLELDPDLTDAKLGIGMYDYYTDVYPHFIGALAKIVLHGNRKRGIGVLHEVAEKGRYTHWTAKMILVEIYNHDRFGGADPKKAAGIMKGIRKSYPGSSMLHSAELVSLLNAKQYEAVSAGASDFLRKVESGEYAELERAKGLLILGHARWFLGKPGEALDAFQKAAVVKLKGQLSRYAVCSLIRGGNVLDTLGRREEAKLLYSSAQKEPDHWGFKKIAAKYHARPFEFPTPPFDIVPELK